MSVPSVLRRSAALLCLCLPAWGGTAAEPLSVVNDFDAALMDAMRNAHAMGPKGRFERLAPVMGEKFDLEAMARDIAGPHWNKLTSEQRERLVAAFSRFEVAIFADWFDSDAGQSFQVKDMVTRNDEIATVGVELTVSPTPLRLDYVLRADPSGTWRIVDIRYEGWMSTVERRRSEFTELFNHDGYDVLMARLEEKGAELLDHPDNPASSHLREPLRDLWSISFAPID